MRPFLTMHGFTENNELVSQIQEKDREVDAANPKNGRESELGERLTKRLFYTETGEDWDFTDYNYD